MTNCERSPPAEQKPYALSTISPMSFYLLNGMQRDIEDQYRVIEAFGAQSVRFHLVLLTLCAN